MIFEKLRSIIAEQLNVDKNEITMDSDVIKDLGCDSLDLVEMLMSVESEWNIEIDDSEVSGIVTVGDVVKFIEKKSK